MIFLITWNLFLVASFLQTYNVQKETAGSLDEEAIGAGAAGETPDYLLLRTGQGVVA